MQRSCLAFISKYFSLGHATELDESDNLIGFYFKIFQPAETRLNGGLMMFTSKQSKSAGLPGFALARWRVTIGVEACCRGHA